MNTDRELMQQALEAFGEIAWSNNSQWQADRAKVAITAIRSALEQPQQERDPAARNGWVLREVLFDNGEPVGHREPQQEPVALFTWLPEGATHIGRISVRTCLGGSLAMSTHAFKYENGVLRVYVTDNDNEYPGWRDAKDVFFHLNFPVLPLYTSPQPSQRSVKPWVGLTDEDKVEILRANGEAVVMMLTEAKLREKNA